MGFKSVLGKIGHDILVGLHIVESVAVVATPIVTTIAPEVASLYTGLLGAAFNAEAAANNAPGTGAQKLALVVAGQLPNIQAILTKNGITMNTDQINKWASAVVDTINLIPAPSAPTPAAPTNLP